MRFPLETEKNPQEKAIKAAQELGVPKDENIAIIAVIEDSWSVYNGWMINFAKNFAQKDICRDLSEIPILL